MKKKNVLYKNCGHVQAASFEDLTSLFWSWSFVIHLRNEFHFSDVLGAMNHSRLRVK